ncbi:MAG: NAD(P)-dependent oxidoreductase [Bacteroidales bacterium]
MEQKRIVIFGATGNLGAYTAIELKKQGYIVIAAGYRKSDNHFFENNGITYYSIDICDSESFKKLPLEQVYAVIHFAGELPSRYEYNPRILIDSIIKGTLNVLEYTRCSGAKKIVFPQTPFDIWYRHNTTTPIKADDVRSFPLTGDHSIYTIAKNAAVDLIEHYHATYGINRFILRFFTIYQYHPNPYHYQDGIKKKMPYRILIDKATNGEPIEIWGDPNRSKEMVYIKDFTQVVHKCLLAECKGGIYNVGGKKTISLEEQIDGIISVFSPTDKPSKKIFNPDKANALQASFDISKTCSELGYMPAYSYIDSLLDFKKEMEEEPFALLWGKKEDYL